MGFTLASNSEVWSCHPLVTQCLILFQEWPVKYQRPRYTSHSDRDPSCSIASSTCLQDHTIVHAKFALPLSVSLAQPVLGGLPYTSSESGTRPSDATPYDHKRRSRHEKKHQGVQQLVRETLAIGLEPASIVPP